eukprot:6216910-Prymnesium_polylepis.1
MALLSGCPTGANAGAGGAPTPRPRPLAHQSRAGRSPPTPASSRGGERARPTMPGRASTPQTRRHPPAGEAEGGAPCRRAARTQAPNRAPASSPRLGR